MESYYRRYWELDDNKINPYLLVMKKFLVILFTILALSQTLTNTSYGGELTYAEKMEIIESYTDYTKQRAKDKCKKLGFTKETEDFDDCVIVMLLKMGSYL